MSILLKPHWQRSVLSPRYPHGHGCVALFSSVKKQVNKPLPRLYPEKLETIGDHLRTKRLDLKLRQKDLVDSLQACHATIKNWEKNYTEPRPHHIPLICGFLNYCPLIENPMKHFGHQLRNYRIFIAGKSIFDLATEIEIDEVTLSEIEQSNVIRHIHVLNSINRFLKSVNWHIANNTKPEFVPTKVKCKSIPKFHAPAELPETLGEHIALKRKQLKLTQAEVMKKIGVVSACAYRSWERYGVSPHVKFYPKIMEFLTYCPIQYCESEGQRLKLIREHVGLSYRQVDEKLNLSKGCTYRVESSNLAPLDLRKKLLCFYGNQ